MSDLLIRYLAFFGSGRKPAYLEFEPGLNVICGASETGKSFIAESIDFMLGQENPVRDIPERARYDRARLVIESEGYPPLTLDRSVEGGHYRAYDELLFDGQPSIEARIVRWKHAASRTDTLSYELLSRIGYAGKVLRSNASGKMRTLSFRDLARLCVVTEEEIQRRGSPVLSGQFVTATSEYSAFKLMLTGNDDSALVLAGDIPARRERDDGKVELLDQMITELQAELDEEGIEEQELRDQEERLNASLEDQAAALQSAQRELNKLMSSRAEAAKTLRGTKARMLEITELVERFTLLDKHYGTDLQRLRAIHESGTLFVHLVAKPCPLCGALPGNQHLDTECDANTEAVVRAANAELVKIERLRRELAETIASLRAEYMELEAAHPVAQKNYDNVESQLRELMVPALSEERASYNELMSKMSAVRSSLEKISRLKNLIERRADIDVEDDGSGRSKQETKTQISKSVLDEFAREIQQILEDWDYPDASRVFFDEGKKDIQISGKERGSTGKGLRAITHAAFTIGLMQFCRERNLPHPGFVVLDSPLLAYWKPEGKDDDLRGTSLKQNFYRYLLGMSKDNQVIIIENEHPPAFVEGSAPVTVFTKNPSDGRYGFFPLN
ncbi:AAA family ATPase [Methylocystis parvus]|uniref:AAA family ATPase n=1 Tax=Methylocystis parvus TaxID=134 RepID=UPI003C782896